MTELEYIKNRIQENLTQIAEHISNGGCEDFGQYQNCCGMIKGFSTIQREIEDLEERMNNTD